uniref:NADH-ubiquinone oxidoreductase chain 1 n=1 Tax=Siphoninus phillyreae TaxID=7040 RepID=Q6JCP4_9HEMI|nr:NADH dehydrogenase subunit 1 [Siphoninus phillyreae]
MINMANMTILLVSVMLSIAFFTLMERKMISYMQNRKGPNKVAMIGVIQPMADAIKLITKELNLNLKSNLMIYLISPVLNILMSLTMWMVFPFLFNFNFMKMSIMLMMACLSTNSITIIAMSWASNSNYAFMGMIRSVAQMISYEINFMMIILAAMNISEQMNLVMFNTLQKYMNIAEMLPTMLVMWIITVLAETSRTPFDFSEGESELVSGFNIEYSSKSFMFLFLAEYSNILIMSMVSTLMFLNVSNKMMLMGIYIAMCFMFVWTRATLPRFRYDKLMKFNWTQLLPTSTTILMITFMMKSNI